MGEVKVQEQFDLFENLDLLGSSYRFKPSNPVLASGSNQQILLEGRVP